MLAIQPNPLDNVPQPIIEEYTTIFLALSALLYEVNGKIDRILRFCF